MAKRRLQSLSVGVFIIILAVSLLLFYPDFWSLLVFTITIYGFWGIVLAIIKAKNPEKYERGAVSTLVWAILLITVGGSWIVYIQTANFVYSAVLILIVIGILAVVLALPNLRKK